MVTGKQLKSSEESRSNMSKKRGVPEGLWQRCPGCGNAIFRKEAEKRQGVCPECDYHFYVSAKERIRQVLDEGTFGTGLSWRVQVSVSNSWDISCPYLSWPGARAEPAVRRW